MISFTEMSRNYKFHNPSAAYFISFATVFWIDVFTRHLYFDVLQNAVTYCRKHKGMKLYAYCFMPSHIHFIFRSKKEDPAGLIRDFKSYTSKTLIHTIIKNPKESRKEWLLARFQEAGKDKLNISQHQFWQHNNQPIELWSTKVIKQKMDYIHNNPVQAGFVTNPIDWKWSSARNIANENPVLEIDEIGFLG